MFDTSAIHKNYCSSTFFKTASLPLIKTTNPRVAKLPNGNLITVHGQATLPLRMLEWVGDVDVNVTDMNRMNCDVILGLPWHRQHRPKPEWESLVYVARREGPQDLPVA
jgi:hypothetical protein